jgi:hypothetical protein
MSGPYNLSPVSPSQPTLEGDEGFVGLNMRDPRWTLQPGYYARGDNKRCHDGKVTDRPGTRTPLFANLYGANTLLGSGPYSNPNGREMGLLATQTKVISIRSGTVPVEIPTPFAPFGRIEFCQQFDKVLMHSDDISMPTLQWDGLDPLGFTDIPEPSLGLGFLPIPRAPWSINFLGRAWFPIPTEPGWMGASDINNYTLYDSILHKFRINTGTSDDIVGAFPYPAQFGLIIGKGRSFDLLGPIPGDLGDSWFRALALNLSPASDPPPSMNNIPGPAGVGLAARKCAVFTGSELLFLSDAGKGAIYRIIQTGRTGQPAGGLEIDPTPVSDMIAPLFNRINWAAIDQACANMDGTFAYFSVPMDGCNFNNAVLVLDIVTRKWAAVDLWFGREHVDRRGRVDPPIPNPLRIDNLIGFEFYGRRRVWAVSNSPAAVRLMYEGRDDQLQQANAAGEEPKTYPIRGVMETRGYATIGATGNMKRKMAGLQLAISTYDPNVVVTELLAGVNDEEVKKKIDPDRTKYDVLSQAPYLITNANDDFLAPKRLDYAIRAGDGFLPGSEPIPIEVEQESVVQCSLSRRTRYASYRVESNGGNATVLGTVVESAPAEREGRTA